MSDATTPTILPLGAVTASRTTPPEGIEGGEFTKLAVACPGILDASATLRRLGPVDGVEHSGTMILATGGPGTSFLSHNGGPEDLEHLGRMIDNYRAEGLTTVEVAWDPPGVWEGPQGSRTLGCRFATVARWIYDEIHSPDGGGFFAAQGNSGGATQISFALAYYGLDEVLDLALLGGGPPPCPVSVGGVINSAEQDECVGRPEHPNEPFLASGNPRLHYSRTAVRFFLGDAEPHQVAITMANAYHDAITSDKAIERAVPGTGHGVFRTDAGRAMLLDVVRSALASRVA